MKLSNPLMWLAAAAMYTSPAGATSAPEHLEGSKVLKWDASVAEVVDARRMSAGLDKVVFEEAINWGDVTKSVVLDQTGRVWEYVFDPQEGKYTDKALIGDLSEDVAGVERSSRDIFFGFGTPDLNGDNLKDLVAWRARATPGTQPYLDGPRAKSVVCVFYGSPNGQYSDAHCEKGRTTTHNPFAVKSP